MKSLSIRRGRRCYLGKQPLLLFEFSQLNHELIPVVSEYTSLLPHVLEMLLDVLVVGLQHHIGGAGQIVQHVAVIQDVLTRVSHSLQTRGRDGFLCCLIILLMLLHQHLLDLYGESEVTYILDVIEEVMLAENILDI